MGPLTGLPLTGTGASLVPPRLSKWPFPASLVPPWCLAGCPLSPGASQAVQLILSCLPGASQAVQRVLSCLSGTSLVPPRLSQMVLSCLPGTSLVPPRLSQMPPWCLAGCPNGPFLLAGASLVPPQAVQRSFPAWCLPGVQMLFCSLPGARSTGSSSRGFRGTDSLLKALVAWPPGSTPDFGRAPDFV